jgi:hypothetical protein
MQSEPRFVHRANAARYLRESYHIPCVAPRIAKYACAGVSPAFQ